MSKVTLEGQFTPMAIGEVFGRLVIIVEGGFRSYTDSDGYTHRVKLWDVRCICGQERTVEGRSLRSGNTTSCGCKCTEAVARGFQKFIAAGGVVPQDPVTERFTTGGSMGTHAEDRWQEFYWNLSEKRKLQADRNYLAARAQFFLDEQRAAEARERLREPQNSTAHQNVKFT
jgi:hypothetical protein